MLRAREVVTSIHEIDYEGLRSRGIRALVFDLDNTLGPRHPTRLGRAVVRLLGRLQDMGFAVGVLSNRRRTGDPVIAELAQRFPLRQRAGKPRVRGFRDLLAKLDVEAADAAMIGDRRLTDILGANRLGMYTIRVKRPAH